MQELELKAVPRNLKKAEVRRLRKTGWIPTILYGRAVTPTPLAVNSKELRQIFRNKKQTSLLRLAIEGEKSAQPLTVIIRDVQVDMITRDYFHMDLQAVDRTQKIHVEIPIVLTGKPLGERKGGIVDHSVRQIEVRCEA